MHLLRSNLQHDGNSFLYALPTDIDAKVPVLGRQVSAAWRQDPGSCRPMAGHGAGLGGQDPGSRAPGAALGRPGGRDPEKSGFWVPKPGPEEGFPARFWDPKIAIFRVFSEKCRNRPKSGKSRKIRIFGRFLEKPKKRPFFPES